MLKLFLKTMGDFCNWTRCILSLLDGDEPMGTKIRSGFKLIYLCVKLTRDRFAVVNPDSQPERV